MTVLLTEAPQIHDGSSQPMLERQNSADAWCLLSQVVNLTQSLIGEFNRTLAYNPYPTPASRPICRSFQLF